MIRNKIKNCSFDATASRSKSTKIFIIIVPNLLRYRFQLPNLSMTKTVVPKMGLENNNAKLKLTNSVLNDQKNERKKKSFIVDNT